MSVKVEAKQEVEALIQNPMGATEISNSIIVFSVRFILLGNETEKLNYAREWVT